MRDNKVQGTPKDMENGNGNGKKGKKFQFKFKLNLRNILFIFLVLVLGGPILLSMGGSRSGQSNLPLSQAIADIREGRVEGVGIAGDKLTVKYKDGTEKVALKESSESFTEVLKNSGVDVSKVNYQVEDRVLSKVWFDILGIILPIGLMGLFLLFIFRQARGAQDNLFSFGKSGAKVFAKGKQSTTFNDVAGVNEAKKELEEIVDFLKRPGKYRAIGARTPKGVLLFGPSGVGKTLLARAVAGEAGVPFFSMAGSEFMEMLVGVGSARVRDLFLTAKKASPSIIFIDEIDAIGRQRGYGSAGGHDEREQTLNQILVEMDGFTPNDNVIVIAASVTGDTPVAIKQNGQVRLIPIGEFIDQYYVSEGVEGEVEVPGVECLGFERKVSQGNLTHKNLYFGHSSFKPVRAVFRHKVKEIYEIEYLGGKIRATGNHSVFVRGRFGIQHKAVADLRSGDVLVDLPFKVNRSNKDLREIRAHKFDTSSWEGKLSLVDSVVQNKWETFYQSAHAAYASGGMSQASIGHEIGVSQSTVGNWLAGKHVPRAISQKYLKAHSWDDLPQEIEITPEFCRLLGYYTAEGYSRWELDFCFSVKEEELVRDVVTLMEKFFGLQPKTRQITPGAVNLVYNCAPVSHFFARVCGKGAHNKHAPSFLFEAPYLYFKEFLRGVWLGDGSEDKHGRGEITTVSQQLAREINWIARMHGLKTYVGSFTAKEGRRIGNGKPLVAVRAWRVGWGKAANPFNLHSVKKTEPSKRALVKSVRKLPFEGFVYDLCGVENEAFFGGESPVLLHNTNRGDLLDPALLRPGRFDRRVTLDLPDKEGREAILKIHAKNKKFAASVRWDRVASRTVGFSGADLENMLNEAAIFAARENRKEVIMNDIEEAATKVKLGPAKRKLQSDDDKKITAYHEAGHALVAHILPNIDPVHRISIVARGMSLGHTYVPPEVDRMHETRTHLLQLVTMMFGGRAAETLVFNEMTMGAANDIDNATNLARRMVIDFGMSGLGPIDLGPQYDADEMGRTRYIEPAQVSQRMQEKIDAEVGKIIDTCYKEAQRILKAGRKTLDKVADELVKVETLDRDEFEKIVGKKITSIKAPAFLELKI